MSNHNEFAYAKQFDGNLSADSKPVPVKVTTRLRIMSKTTAEEIRKYSSHRLRQGAAVCLRRRKPSPASQSAGHGPPLFHVVGRCTAKLALAY